MADQGLFGSPIGEIAFDENQLTRAKTGLTLEEIASAPVMREMYKQHGRLFGAQADTAMLELEASRRMAAELARRASSPSAGAEDQSFLAVPGAGEFGATGAVAQPQQARRNQFWELSDIAAGAGSISKATDLAKMASLIDSREALVNYRNVKAAEGQVDYIRKNANLVGQTLGGVTNEAGWQRANALLQFQTGRPSPFADMPFSPELVKSLEEAAIEAPKKAELDLQQKRDAALKKFRDARLEQHDADRKIRQQRADLTKEREERLAKNGGGRAIVSPAKGEIDQALRLIKKDYANMAPADLNEAAYDIAANARALRRANPALDANMAIQQAFATAKEDFEPTGNVKVFGQTIGKEFKFNGAGKNPLAPSKMPADQKNLRVDRFYINPTGLVGKWTGKGFQLVDTGRALSDHNSREEADLSDESDDNEEE